MAPNEAAQLAAKYRGQGFQTLKLKVGKNLNSDIEVLKAIRLVHPDCSFILDANEGYTADQAIEVLDRLNGSYSCKFCATIWIDLLILPQHFEFISCSSSGYSNLAPSISPNLFCFYSVTGFRNGCDPCTL